MLRGDEVRLCERDQNPAGNGLNVEIDLADGALARAVRVEARELLAGEKNGLHRSGRSGGRRCPEVERHGRVAGEIDAAGEVIAERFAARVGFSEGLEQNHLHGERA